MLFNRDYNKEFDEDREGNIINYCTAFNEGYNFYNVIFKVATDKYIEINVCTRDNSLTGLWLRDDRPLKDYHYSEAKGLVYLENITNEAGMLDSDLFIKYCGGWE